MIKYCSSGEAGVRSIEAGLPSAIRLGACHKSRSRDSGSNKPELANFEEPQPGFFILCLAEKPAGGFPPLRQATEVVA